MSKNPHNFKRKKSCPHKRGDGHRKYFIVEHNQHYKLEENGVLDFMEKIYLDAKSFKQLDGPQSIIRWLYLAGASVIFSCNRLLLWNGSATGTKVSCSNFSIRSTDLNFFLIMLNYTTILFFFCKKISIYFSPLCMLWEASTVENSSICLLYRMCKMHQLRNQPLKIWHVGFPFGWCCSLQIKSS